MAAWRPSACSGAMYGGEPIGTPLLVRSPPRSMILARLKSVIRGMKFAQTSAVMGRQPTFFGRRLQQYIARFEIAMQYSAVIHVLHGVCDTGDEPSRITAVDRPVSGRRARPPSTSGAFAVRSCNICHGAYIADLVDRHDVRMVEPGGPRGPRS